VTTVCREYVIFGSRRDEATEGASNFVSIYLDIMKWVGRMPVSNLEK
jgi:hypothetical protein